MAKHRVSDEIITALDGTAIHLQRLMDPDNLRCGVDPEHKKGVSGYIVSWILPHFEGTIAWAKGEDDVRSKWIYLGSGNEQAVTETV
jgi:hypothetical protein